jgi:hypothetical protein
MKCQKRESKDWKGAVCEVGCKGGEAVGEMLPEVWSGLLCQMLLRELVGWTENRRSPRLHQGVMGEVLGAQFLLSKDCREVTWMATLT